MLRHKVADIKVIDMIGSATYSTSTFRSHRGPSFGANIGHLVNCEKIGCDRVGYGGQRGLIMEQGSQNDFSGKADTVIQAGNISGNVIFGGSAKFPLPVPRQLPGRIKHFVNRESQLEELDSLFSLTNDGFGVMVVSAIEGTAGVGKTALAIHWAHHARNRFPHGDLYLNLRGYDSEPPVDSNQALDIFLRSLGVPIEDIPLDMSAKAALYRSLLNDRRVLIVLDNAVTSGQVRPLLPSSPTCLVIVTSRSHLSGLAIRDGAELVMLDLLSVEKAHALLRRIIGDSRVDAEPEATAKLIQLCVRLPLAVRIAGERISVRPDARISDLVAELADERDRLDALSDLEDHETAVRAVFRWSYKALLAPTARMFRLLGLHVGPDISIGAAAALADIRHVDARRLLESLAEVHLITRVKRDRYRFHDLLRCYAAECAEEEPREQRDGAITRILAWYLHNAASADHAFAPSRRRVPLDPSRPSQALSFDGHADALEWCDAERANLLAATRQAADRGRDAIAWQLPAVMGEFLALRRHYGDWIVSHEIGLAAAQRLADHLGEGWLLTNLALVHFEVRKFQEAANYGDRALAVVRGMNDLLLEGVVLTNLGLALSGLERFEEAADNHRQALTIHQSTGNSWGEAWALTNLGRSLEDLGRHDEAINHLEQALQQHHNVGNLWGKGMALNNLGIALQQSGRLEDSADILRNAVVVHGDSGNQWGEADALVALGDALRDSGHPDMARVHWRAALGIFEHLGAPQADGLRAQLDESQATAAEGPRSDQEQRNTEGSGPDGQQ